MTQTKQKKPVKQAIKLNGLSYGGIITSIVGSSLGILTVFVIWGIIPIFHTLWNEESSSQDPEVIAKTWHLIKIMMIFLGHIYLFGAIASLAFNVRSLKNPTRQKLIVSGILAILFGEGPIGIIGGILTLTGNENKHSVPTKVDSQS